MSKQYYIKIKDQKDYAFSSMSFEERFGLIADPYFHLFIALYNRTHHNIKNRKDLEKKHEIAV